LAVISSVLAMAHSCASCARRATSWTPWRAFSAESGR